MVNDEPVIQTLGKLVVADDQFILTPKGVQTVRTAGGSHGEQVTYKLVANCMQVLSQWKLGMGREEVWFGTLKAFFPLHVESELKYLKKQLKPKGEQQKQVKAF